MAERGRPRKPGELVRGPYQRRDGRWQVDRRGADGERGCRTFAVEEEAAEYAAILRADLRASHPTTVAEALVEYEQAMRAKGNKDGSVKDAMRALERFFPDRATQRLGSISVTKARAMYKALVEETKVVVVTQGVTAPMELEVQALKADSHRKYLAAARTFGGWCVAENLLRVNPFVEVKKLGKQSHGKAQHRVDELRKWEAKAWDMAQAGDVGALAALLTLYLGFRASEVTHLVVRDVDDRGRLVWVADAKTPTGRRAVEVPEALRPMLLDQLTGKGADRLLFPAEVKPGEPQKEHWRDWPRENVQRICRLVGVPKVTAHGMRGALATIAAERGQLGHLAALHFGHTDVAVTEQSYAAPGVKDTATRAAGLAVLRVVK